MEGTGPLYFFLRSTSMVVSRYVTLISCSGHESCAATAVSSLTSDVNFGVSDCALNRWWERHDIVIRQCWRMRRGSVGWGLSRWGPEERRYWHSPGALFFKCAKCNVEMCAIFVWHLKGQKCQLVTLCRPPERQSAGMSEIKNVG